MLRIVQILIAILAGYAVCALAVYWYIDTSGRRVEVTYTGPVDTRSLLARWQLDPDNFARISLLADVENLIGRNSAILVFLSTEGEAGFSWDTWVSATGAERLERDVGLSRIAMPLPDGRFLLEAGASTGDFRAVHPDSGHRATIVRLTDGIVLHIGGLDNADVESMLSLPVGTIRTRCPSRDRNYRVAFENDATPTT
jgi:hypothetical protein